MDDADADFVLIGAQREEIARLRGELSAMTARVMVAEEKLKRVTGTAQRIIDAVISEAIS